MITGLCFYTIPIGIILFERYVFYHQVLRIQVQKLSFIFCMMCFTIHKIKAIGNFLLFKEYVLIGH